MVGVRAGSTSDRGSHPARRPAGRLGASGPQFRRSEKVAGGSGTGRTGFKAGAAAEARRTVSEEMPSPSSGRKAEMRPHSRRR